MPDDPSPIGGMIGAMHQVTEVLKVAFDAADGLRTDLAGRGYSPTAAEQVAVEFLSGVVRTCFGGVTK